MSHSKGYQFDSEQEDKLVKQNIGLVVFLARSFNPKNHTDLDDYISSGLLGLLFAIRKYNAKLGNGLATLAWTCIRNEILRYIKTQKRIEYPSYLVDDIAVPYKENLWEYIPDTLSELEEEVLMLRCKNYTFNEIGSQYKYSKVWAYHIYQTAINKIRECYV